MPHLNATDRFTFRLDSIAQQAIAMNEGLFLRETGLTILEIRMLRMIDDDPGTTFVEISRRIAIERTKVSRILQKLLSMELIRRENSTEDARRFRLFATPRGQEVRGRSEELSDRLESLLLAPLPANEVADMNAKLAKILRWVESSDYTAQLAQMAAQDQTSGPS